jgi:hypothetical protein
MVHRRKVTSVRLVNYLNRGVFLGLLLSGGIASSAYASLVFEGLESGNGAGIGASNIVLTIQNTGTESGCVAWNGTADVVGSSACPGGLTPAITGGNEKTGNSQVQTQTVQTLAINSGFSMVVIFNANEPSGDSITLDNLSLTIYSPTGTVLFNSGNVVNGPVVISASDTGQGNLGFGFRLDQTQAALADQYISCAACGLNRIGIAALASNAAGANETFAVLLLAPEPLTWLTFASGLIALAIFRRYRRVASRA